MASYFRLLLALLLASLTTLSCAQSSAVKMHGALHVANGQILDRNNKPPEYLGRKEILHA
jgi:hypothetical protein